MQGIVTRWTAVCSAALTALNRQAQVEITFVTRQVVMTDSITLALTLVNHGPGVANNLRGELLPGEGYTILKGEDRVDQLAPHQRVQIQFTLHPTVQATLQPRVQVCYDDQEQANKSQFVGASIQPLVFPTVFTPIPNPYSPGLPLRPNSPLFFGREELFAFLEETVSNAASGCVLVLTGQRRMGKTSLAQQLPVRLRDHCAMIYLDSQALAIDPGMASFLYDVALAIADTLALPAPDAADFAQRPAAFFEREFLPHALAATGNRRLLLLFDEYEELEMRVMGGKLGPEVFAFLRHLMQHVEGLGFIFVGVHPLASLNPVYWSAFFNLALHRQIRFLAEEAARCVITQPVTPHLAYDDLALAKMVRVTSGHPYFLQLLCHTLVSAANRAQRSYVLLDHVNEALEPLLELGEAHLIFLWDQLAPAEKRLLQVAAELTTAGSPLTPGVFAQRLLLSEKEIQTLLSRLVQCELLRPSSEIRPAYEFVVDLLRLWLGRRLQE
jgi:hypothetical protein